MNRKFLCSLVGLFFVALSQINAQDSIVTNYQKAWRKKIDRETSEIKAQLSLNEFNKQRGADSLNKYIFCYAGENYLSLLEDLSTEDASYVQFEGKEIKKADYLGSEASINQLFTELDINYKRKVIIYVTDVVRPELSPVQNDKEGKPLSVSEYDKDKEFFKQYFSYLLTKLYGAQSGEYTMLAYLRVFRTQPASLSQKGTRFEYTHKRIFNYQKGLPAGCISLLENKIVNNEDGIFTSGGNQSGQVYQCANLIYSTLKSECPNVVNPMLPLTVSQRIREIKRYLENGLTDAEEIQVLKLISETPGNDIEAFLAQLQKDDLLYKIIGSTQNSILGFYGGNHYATLMNVLTQLVLKNEKSINDLANWDINHFVDRVIFWDRKGLLATPPIGNNSYVVDLLKDGSGTIRYSRYRVKDVVAIHGMMGETTIDVREEKIICPDLKPFDLVLFFDRSNLGMIDEGLVGGGGAKLVPAIFLKYAADMKFNDDALNGAALIGDVVSLASGPGFILKAGWVVRAFIVIEMAGAVGNIAVQVADLGNSKYADLVERYNLIMTGVGIVNLSITTVPDALKATKNISKGIAKKLTGEYIAAVMSFESELLNLSVKGNRSAEDVLKLKEILYKEWKIQFGNFDKSFYAIKLPSLNKVLHYGGWGGDVLLVEGITTTVIGKWFDELTGYGTRQVLNLQEGSFTRGLPNPGGINILDLPSDEYNALLTKNIKKYTNRGESIESAIIKSREDGMEEFWIKYNLPFIEDAFKRGDNVRLLSDLNDPKVLYGFFKREVELIKGIDGKVGLASKYGYEFNSITFTYEKVR